MDVDSEPYALVRAAQQLEREGRDADAVATYQRLLSHWPDLPDSWYNLARLQRRARQYDAALASYQQALDRGVTQPEEVHLNRGVIYSDCLRQDAAAERELNAALGLNPDYVPALLNLANLKEDLGRRDEALVAYERLLTVDPDCHEGLARYASLKSPVSSDDPLVIRLRRTIDRVDVSAGDKASLGFALGKLLDTCGEYDQAFAAYSDANTQSRASAASAALLYDRQRHEQSVEQLIASYTRDHSRSAVQGGPAPPIFICGMFRSGSTLTEQILAGHPRVTAGGELDLLPALLRSRSSQKQWDPDQLAADYRKALANLFPDADRVTDKRPDNFLNIGLIKRLFPAAKIVHTTRDPLDNCLSIYFLHLDHGMRYALDLEDIGHYYLQYRRLMAHWKSLYGTDILDFDYDAFVREPRPAAARLLAHCDLPWDEGCLDFHRVRNAVKTASVWQVRQPIYQSSSGRAQHYWRHLESLRAYLNELYAATR